MHAAEDDLVTDPSGNTAIAPDARTVTVADTLTGERPDDKRMLDEVGPNPMPRAPSTSEAQNPAKPMRSSSSLDAWSRSAAS